MNDFLGNLVARSLSLTAAVRPQVMSIYEQPQQESASVIDGSAAAEPFAVERETGPFSGEERLAQLQSLWHETSKGWTTNAESLLPENRTERFPSRSEMNENVGDLDVSEAAVKNRPIAPSEHHEFPLPHKPAPAEEQPVPVTLKRRNRPKKSPMPASVVRYEPAEKHSIAVPVAVEEETPSLLPNAVAAQNRHASVRAVHDAEAQPASATEIVPAQKARPAPAAPIVPTSIVVSPRVLPPPIYGEGKTEPPSIHVTIGRVEVRATPPPAARSRSQPASAPVMGLDEYLRQRAAGGRR